MMNGFNDAVGVPLRNFDRNKRSDFGKCIKNLVSDWSTALVDEYNEDRNKSIKEMLYLKPCIESRKWSCAGNLGWSSVI